MEGIGCVFAVMINLGELVAAVWAKINFGELVEAVEREKGRRRCRSARAKIYLGELVVPKRVRRELDVGELVVQPRGEKWIQGIGSGESGSGEVAFAPVIIKSDKF